MNHFFVPVISFRLVFEKLRNLSFCGCFEFIIKNNIRISFLNLPKSFSSGLRLISKVSQSYFNSGLQIINTLNLIQGSSEWGVFWVRTWLHQQRNQKSSRDAQRWRQNQNDCVNRSDATVYKKTRDIWRRGMIFIKLFLLNVKVSEIWRRSPPKKTIWASTEQYPT